MTIRVRDLEVAYLHRGRRVDALRGLDFDVAAGETVAIIGRSGAGKSTLIRALAGLLLPTAGTVELAGHTPDANRADRAFCRDVGLVFQDHGLVGELTARDNVLCGRLFEYDASRALLSWKPEHRTRCDAILTGLGLSERLDTRASKLSGGERQRVAVSRLLHQGPKVALLDEPVASLDIHWADATIRAIGEMHDGEVTTVAILHDLELVRRWADRVIWLEDGVIAFDGDPDEACRLLESAGGRVPPPARSDSDEPGKPNEPEPAKRTEPSEPGIRPGGSPGLTREVWYGAMLLGLLGLFVWSAFGVEFSLLDLLGSLPNGVDFLGRTFPPDFSVAPTIFDSLVETLQMAFVGTVLAAMVALPLSIAGAGNIAPGWVFGPARLVMNMMRTIPSIIWGLFFVAIVGLGPFPGILALTFYAAGYLGKFYYESIESIDPRPLSALRSVGAGRLQRFRWGVFPQVLPLLLGHTLYMLEYNVRAASILGIVGAGGIGFYLHAYVNNFQYPRAATAILMLLVVVTVIDAASTRLRHWVMA